MPSTPADSEAWKRLVLQSMSPPDWLVMDGPHRDIVLSTRVRFMRNLRGHRFPHAASTGELREIQEKIVAPFRDGGRYEILRHASPAERDYLVACRLVSPEFDWHGSGRTLVLDSIRSSSAMVNEEDHVRIQALAPGWSLSRATSEAEALLKELKSLEFAASDRYGFLAASPANCGAGLRYSAMFHPIGLAHARKLGMAIKALSSQGLVVRGLFGERSRGIGALIQVSTTASSVPHFVGACEYLLAEEHKARQGTPDEVVQKKLSEMREFAEAIQTVTLSDALRVLAWVRWHSALAGRRSPTPCEIDALIPELALLESLGEPRAGRSRAVLLRRVLSL